jgi:ABC-type antimicrobial peptide transport system permease subunit
VLASSVHGFTASTSNLQTLSEIAFAFRITPAIVGASLAFALVMGVLGGLLPAYRASRMPIAGALRQG